MRAPDPTGVATPRRSPTSRVDRFIDRAEQRPKAPWHPVPLVELSVLAGIVAIVVGLINRDSERGRLAILLGLALASLAGLDTAARDHFGGFRSHSSLLASMPTVLTAILMGVIGVQLPIVLPAALVVFAISFWFFRSGFKRRTGVGFKV